jgi:hypothetical protein
MVKSWNMRLAGHVEGIRRKRSAYRILVGKHRREETVGIPRVRCENTIKTDLKYDRKLWIGFLRLRIETRAKLM